MDTNIPTLTNEQLASMPLGDKLGLALKISLRKFPLYIGLYLLFAVVLCVLCFIFALISPGLLIVGATIAGLLSAPYGVGILSLILKHARGEAYNSIFEVVLEPFQRIPKIIIPIAVWYMAAFIILFLISLMAFFIPILGLLMALAVYLIVMVLFSCLIFFIADNKGSTMGEYITKPFIFTFNNLEAWVSSILAAILAYLPSAIVYSLTLMALAGAALASSAIASPEDFSMLAAGIGVGSLLLFLLAALLAVIGSVFFTVSAAISYLQSCARETLKSAGQQQFPS